MDTNGTFDDEKSVARSTGLVKGLLWRSGMESCRIGDGPYASIISLLIVLSFLGSLLFLCEEITSIHFWSPTMLNSGVVDCH